METPCTEYKYEIELSNEVWRSAEIHENDLFSCRESFHGEYKKFSSFRYIPPPGYTLKPSLSGYTIVVDHSTLPKKNIISNSTNKNNQTKSNNNSKNNNKSKNNSNISINKRTRFEPRSTQTTRLRSTTNKPPVKRIVNSKPSNLIRIKRKNINDNIPNKEKANSLITNNCVKNRLSNFKGVSLIPYLNWANGHSASQYISPPELSYNSDFNGNGSAEKTYHMREDNFAESYNRKRRFRTNTWRDIGNIYFEEWVNYADSIDPFYNKKQRW